MMTQIVTSSSEKYLILLSTYHARDADENMRHFFRKMAGPQSSIGEMTEGNRNLYTVNTNTGNEINVQPYKC
jgi:hypothetical protein